MVSTVFRSVETPFFNKRVTGPVAFDQVRRIGVPVLTPTNAAGVMVNCAALARATAAAATRRLENCMLKVVRVFGID